MKKFLLSMAMVLGLAASASAVEVSLPETDKTWADYTWTLNGTDYSGIVQNYTLKLEKGSSSNDLVSPDKYSIRVYAGAQLTVTAPEGVTFDKVTVTINATGNKAVDATASTGWTVSEFVDGVFTITATTPQTSVTFDGNGKQLRVGSMVINASGEGTEPGPGTDPDPDPQPQPEGTTYTLLTTMAPGNYIIGADDAGSYKAATAYDDGKTYGYMPVVDATVDGDEITTTASTYSFEAAEGGYYIKDAKGNYLIQTGTFNSFNLVSTPSATEGVFTVTIAADGYATIVNTGVNKTLAYGVGFNSFGSYPELSDTRVLPKLYVSKSDAINDVNVDNSNAPVEFFNLQGMRINEPAAGQIVIRRQGNQVSKILVK